MSVAMNTKLRLFIVAAVLTIGGHSANAADNDNHSKDPILGKCSDIVAGRDTNVAAPAIGRLCDRNPENKLALMVKVLILKFLFDKGQMADRDRPGANPSDGAPKIVKVSDKVGVESRR
jgi:hypothetical protein